MESLGFLIFIALAAFLGVYFLPAYREARTWPEVRASWGQNQSTSLAVHVELVRLGIRCKLKVIGTPDLSRMLPQRFTSVRVHEDDVHEAHRIILGMRDRAPDERTPER